MLFRSIEAVSTGVFNLMVPLRKRATLDKIELNIAALRSALKDQGVVAYCFALGPSGYAFSRGMLPWEIGEDPATGSAGGSLGAYLVKHHKLAVGKLLEIKQGYEMDRPSQIHVQVLQEKGNNDHSSG